MGLSKELEELMSNIETERRYSLICKICFPCKEIDYTINIPFSPNELNRKRKFHIKEVHSADLTSKSRL